MTGIHHAYGAFAFGTPWRLHILAVASYEAKDERTVEVAFAVDDEFHGIGLGTLLLERLAFAAHGAGFTRLWAVTQPDNLAMREVFHESGFEMRERFEGNEMEVELLIRPPGLDPTKTDLRERIARALASGVAPRGPTSDAAPSREPVWARIAPDPPPAARAPLGSLGGLVRVVISGGSGGDWSLGLQLGPGEIDPEPRATIRLAERDADALASGELGPVEAFLGGRVGLSGDLSLLMKLQAAAWRG